VKIPVRTYTGFIELVVAASQREVLVLMLKIFELDICSVPTPGRSYKNFDPSSLGSTQKDKVSVKV
jgi:hypothetical protein